MCKDTGRELTEEQKKMLAEIEGESASLLTRVTTAAARHGWLPIEAHVLAPPGRAFWLGFGFGLASANPHRSPNPADQPQPPAPAARLVGPPAANRPAALVAAGGARLKDGTPMAFAMKAKDRRTACSGACLLGALGSASRSDAKHSI